MLPDLSESRIAPKGRALLSEFVKRFHRRLHWLVR